MSSKAPNMSANMKSPVLTISVISLTLLISACTPQTLPTPAANKSTSDSPATRPLTTIGDIITLGDLSLHSKADDSAHYKNELTTAVAQNYNEEFQWQTEHPLSLETALRNRMANTEELKRICEEYKCTIHKKGFFDGSDVSIAKHADKFLVTWYTNLHTHDDFSQAKTFLAEFSSLDSLQTISTTVHSMHGAWSPSDEHLELRLLKLSEIHHYGPLGSHQCVSAGCRFKGLLLKQNNIIAKADNAEVAMGRYGGGSTCTIVETEEVLLCKSQPYGGTDEVIHSVTLLK